MDSIKYFHIIFILFLPTSYTVAITGDKPNWFLKVSITKQFYFKAHIVISSLYAAFYQYPR